jgi:hypothetical protein
MMGNNVECSRIAGDNVVWNVGSCAFDRIQVDALGDALLGCTPNSFEVGVRVLGLIYETDGHLGG